MNKAHIAAWIAYPVFAIGMFWLFFFVHEQGVFAMYAIISPLFFAGIFTLGVGALGLLGHFGAFDFVAYGFRDLFVHFNPKYRRSEDKYKDYVDYVNQKEEKRKKIRPYPWPWLAVGVSCLVAGFILRAIVYSV